MRPVALLFLLLAAACGRRGAAADVERIDIALAVQADGSIRVEELIAVRVGDRPVTTFRRRTPVWRHDGVSDVTATLDGTPLEPGRGAGFVQVGRGPALDVSWTLAPLPGGTRVLGLRYRAARAVGLSGMRGAVSWLALPADRDFDVADAHVALALPATAVLLQDPWMEEPGWRVTRLPNGLTATRSRVARGEPATVGVEFTADRMAAPVPRWQTDRELAAHLVPAFISAALFILVVAGGVLWMVRFRFPPWRLSADDCAGMDVGGVTPVLRRALASGRIGDRAMLEELVAAGLADPERVTAARELRRAGIAVLVFGAAAGAAVWIGLPQFGAWLLAVPGSIMAAGVVMFIAATRLPIVNRRGAAAGMLYSARASDGHTSA